MPRRKHWYCPVCGKPQERPPGVLDTDVWTCSTCRVPRWYHELHQDADRALEDQRRIRAVEKLRKKWEDDGE